METNQPPARANIIAISFDDAVAYWKYKTVFRHPLHTPNLDRICEQSTAFHSAYCQAPICGPSRASLMSAKSPHQLGIFENGISLFENNKAAIAWSSRLRQDGYYCSSGGKIHHFFRPLRTRIHRALYDDDRKRFRPDMNMPAGVRKKRFGGHRGGWATIDPADDSQFHDYQSADSAIEFLETYQGDAPFYREVGFYGPHGPHFTPSRFKEMYTQRGFRQPKEWEDGFDTNEFVEEYMPENMDLSDLRYWRQCVRNYFSALTHTDYHLGRVWDALKASPHADNTIVVILSDHGFHLGNKNRFCKKTLWEQSAGVPLILHDPRDPKCQEIHDPVALLDVGPTVLDYAGLPAIEDTMGRSLRPQIEGFSNPDRAVPTFSQGSVSIRKGDYRFIRYRDGSTELFNVTNDFWQLRDLGSLHDMYDPMFDALIDTSQAYGFDLGAP